MTSSALDSPVAPTATVTPLSPEALSEIVCGLAHAEGLWRPHVAHDELERVRLRLLATPAYEVWLLGWTPGQSTGLHDHGRANAAFVVVDGELTETTADGGQLTDHVLRAGDLGTVHAGTIHDVANRSTVNATSIHAYSHPLTEMGYYGPDGGLQRIEPVEEQPTLIA